ncbi:MAG: hypothetical protein KF849_17675 [Rhizobiaceae bacterium]|nr:hypothetical protein [Rhizobiaceae bacterium]
MRLSKPFVAAVAVGAGMAPALAACPVELAVYRDRDAIAELNFSPVDAQAAVTNRFKLIMRDGPVFEGHVLWTDDPARPYGQLLFECPEGDVTGDELAACSVWQGTIYTLGADNTIGLMPGEGEPAPEKLLLADLGYQMRWSATWEKAGLKAVPWDEFRLAGCQE